MDKYPTWKRICYALAGLLLLFLGGFIARVEGNIQRLYETKADKETVVEMKSDIKDIQKDIKILIRRR